LKNAKELSKFVYLNTGKKIHWYLGSCCYDTTSVWSMEEVTASTYSTSLEDCDILVVGTKLGREDIKELSAVIGTKQREVVAFGNCVISGGIFNMAGQMPTLKEHFEVDLYIPGCPPTFNQLKSSLCQFLDIKEQ